MAFGSEDKKIKPNFGIRQSDLNNFAKSNEHMEGLKKELEERINKPQSLRQLKESLKEWKELTGERHTSDTGFDSQGFFVDPSGPIPM